jgi:very-long-chain enoyl-CoA reductase
MVNYVGIALYLFGEIANFNAHVVLSKLRKPGGTERGIPKGFGFGTVTCPNYSFELLAWIGIALVTKSCSTLLFGAIAYVQMRIWAQKKERQLREFGDKYPKKRNGIIPGPWRKL